MCFLRNFGIGGHGPCVSKLNQSTSGRKYIYRAFLIEFENLQPFPIEKQSTHENPKKPKIYPTKIIS